MHNKKALIIEDDGMMRRVFERLLAREGFESVSISEPKAIYDSLAGMEEKPSVIMLDLMMAEVSGLEVLAHLKKDPAWKGVPVVVITNVAGDEAKEKALALGASLYLTKSENDPHELVAKIKSVLTA